MKLLDGYEMVRGSSPSIDNKVVEDVSSSFIVAGTRTFTVSHYPIVNGDGTGTITNKTRDIVVKVNGEVVIVATVIGLTGTVTLALAPNPSDTVTCSYYYKKTDTKVIDEDVSTQADGSTTVFYTAHVPIVDGSNAGKTTTNVSDIIVKVNNSLASVSHLDGANGAFTLSSAPLLGDTVTVTYYFNQHANTADDLPVEGITRMVRVGYSPETSDFIEDVDFAIIASQVQWGTGYKLVPDSSDSGIFDENMIVVSIFDNKMYREDVSSQFTGTEDFCYVNKLPIVDGDGTKRDDPTSDPADVIVEVNGVEVEVRRVQGDIGKITLMDAPPVSAVVTVTYWYSRIEDGEYDVEVVTPGGSGVGTYKVSYTDVIGNTINVGYANWLTTDTAKFYSDSLPTIPLAYTVNETVTITVTASGGFTVSSTLGLTGSHGFGTIGQTYIDATTGFFFTLRDDISVPDTISVVIVKTATAIPVTTVPRTSIPGVKLTIQTTADAADILGNGDKTKLYVFNKSGNEPAVSDVYYVTYYYEKTNFEPLVFTKFKDITNEYGSLSENNPMVLTAYLMFLNGASALMCYQVQKATDSEIAPDQSYYDAIDRLKQDVNGLNPAVMFPVTSSQSVIEYTSVHVIQMSSKRYRRERISFFGYAVGTEPLEAANFAAGIKNERMIAVYPDGATIELVDAEGQVDEYVVDGTYLAAALVGVNVNTIYDVATPMTRKQIVGFKDLVRSMDEPTMDMVASKGVTIIMKSTPFIVRHCLTTNMDSTLTREANVITIKDFIQQETRRVLDPYIGRKFLEGLTDEVVKTEQSMLRSAKQAEIIVAFTGVTAVKDTEQPDFIKVTAYYIPIVGVNWIDVTLNIRVRF